MKMTLRETADCLINWAVSSTRQEHLEVLRQMMDVFIINRFRTEPDLAHEYSRVDIALRGKEMEFQPLSTPTEEFSEN